MINQHLSETKARMMAQIKEKKSVDTNEEIYIKKQIQEMLARINANLIGLKQSRYALNQVSIASILQKQLSLILIQAKMKLSRQ